MSRNVASGTVAARFIIYFFQRLMLWDDILSSEVVHTKYEDKVLNEKQFFINGFRKWFSTFDCSSNDNHTKPYLIYIVLQSHQNVLSIQISGRFVSLLVAKPTMKQIHGETNKPTNKHSFHTDYVECSRPYLCYMVR